jgi:hypothetical protein
MALTVPPEIHTHVLDLYIGSLPREHGLAHVLRPNALVCRAWLARCRREFSRVVLVEDWDPENYLDFHLRNVRSPLAWPRLLFLISRSYLYSYVEEIYVSMNNYEAAHAARACLVSAFPNLRRLRYECLSEKVAYEMARMTTYFPQIEALSFYVPVNSSPPPTNIAALRIE